MLNTLSRKLSILKKQVKFAVISGIFYILGIIIGIIYFKKKTFDGVFFKSVFDFYRRTFDMSTKPIYTFLLRLLIDFGYIIIVFVLGLSAYLSPLNLLVIGYRGAIVGCVGCVFLSLYGFNGGAVFFAVVLPQNFIVSLAIIISAVLNLHTNMYAKKCDKKKDIFINCIVGYIIMIVGAVYELLITMILLRPLNFYF